VVGRVAALSALDRRVAWQVSLARLVLHEVREGVRAAQEVYAKSGAHKSQPLGVR